MDDLTTLSSGRVRLRRWRDADRDAFAAINADPRVMEFFPSPLTRACSDAMIDYIEAHFDRHGFGLWALELPGVAPLIGFTGLLVPRLAAHFTPCVEIGWRLRREFWGRGIGLTAARLAERHAFETLRLRELVSFTAAGNRRSRRLMERLGFTHDPRDDFLHPLLPEDSPLRRHVLYRKSNPVPDAGAG